MDRITVVKIGGSTLGSHDTTIDDIVELQHKGNLVVVVHGGGKLITEWLSKLGITSRFLRGERVTDRPSLEVVTAVLAGLVNKDIVASINSKGGRAAGISGVDGVLVEGKIAEAEKGFVGAVTEVNTGILKSLMAGDFVPVVAPVGFHAGPRHKAAPATLNFNADVVAGEIAAALDAESLIFLTDVPGILDASKHVVPCLSPGEAQSLLDSGVAAGGMIPKVQACLRAVSAGSSTCIVDGREPHALTRAIEKKGGGTLIH